RRYFSDCGHALRGPQSSREPYVWAGGRSRNFDRSTWDAGVSTSRRSRGRYEWLLERRCSGQPGRFDVLVRTSEVRTALGAGLVQPAVPVAVEEIDREPDQQPDSEPLPGRWWQAAHDEKASRRGEQRHRPNEWNLEGSFPVWILVPQHKHADAHE